MTRNGMRCCIATVFRLAVVAGVITGSGACVGAEQSAATAVAQPPSATPVPAAPPAPPAAEPAAPAAPASASPSDSPAQGDADRTTAEKAALREQRFREKGGKGPHVDPPPEGDGSAKGRAAAEQRAAEAAAPSAPSAPAAEEPKLRFNFRFQKWADVLEWVALQADLSLVLDAPPPGTFNYTDEKEYTPTEAIDRLNEVLLTKGYTLVRRDRMLVVLDLKQGVPEGMIPKVSIDELEKRGRFELVTVQFPLGRKDAAVGAAEIKLLLSPVGKVVPLPATKQLLVTDTAGVMRAISVVIESLPEPKEEKKPEERKPEEKPTLVVYPADKFDVNTALNVLGTLFGNNTKFVKDPKTDQILAFATPSQHNGIKAFLEKMEADNPPDKQPYLEVYSLEGIGGIESSSVKFYPRRDKFNRKILPSEVMPEPQVVETLKSVVPDAQMTVDSINKKLNVWATPDEHEKIKGALEKLRSTPVMGAMQELQVYEVKVAELDNLEHLLQNMFPDAQITGDRRTRKLFAIAMPEEHKVIQETLTEIEKPASPESQPRFESYTIPGVQHGYAGRALSSTLEQLVPGARLAVDFESGKLIVWGTDAEQKMVQGAIAKLTEGGGATIQMHRLTTDPRSVLRALEHLVPEARITVDEKTGNLIAFASPQDQKTIADTLAQLQPAEAGPDTPEMRVYPLERSLPSGIMDVLQRLVPRAEISRDQDGSQLIVVATPAEHEQVKKALAEATKTPPPELARRFETFAIPALISRSISGMSSRVQTITSQLQSLVPNARLTVDVRHGTLIAFGTPSELEIIRGAVGKLAEVQGGQGGPYLMVYPVGDADPQSVSRMLSNILPEVQTISDAKARTLAVFAPASDHETVRATIESMAASAAGSSETAVTYTLEQIPATSAMQVLRLAVPNAQLSQGATSNQIIAYARASDQERIKQTLQQVDVKGPPEKEAKVVIYTVRSDSTQRTYYKTSFIRDAVPGARMTVGYDPSQLIVWATPKDHETVKSLLDQLDVKESPETAPKAAVYTLQYMTSQTAQRILEEAVPDAQIEDGESDDQMVVWARPADHEVIKTTLQELDVEGIGQNDETPVIYTLRSGDSRRSYFTGRFLMDAVPSARFTIGNDPGRLIVWAKPKDHETIKGLLEQVEAKEPAETAPKPVVYKLQFLSAETARRILELAVPEARLEEGEDDSQLIAFARPADHLLIDGTLKELDVEGAGDGDAKPIVYTIEGLGDRDSFYAMRLLRDAVPKASFTLGSDPSQIIAWARPKDHETIKSLIDQLTAKAPPETAKTMEIYSLKYTEASAAIRILSEIAPDAEFTQGSDPGQVVVYARPAEHAEIAKAVAKMSEQGPSDTASSLKTYTLERTPAATAMFAIRAMVPRAYVAQGSDPNQVLVWASPADHEMIQKVIAELGQKLPPESAPMAVTYTLESITASVAMQVLRQAVPQAQLNVGADQYQMVAFARPADHEQIKTTLAQIDVEGAADKTAAPVVYSFEGMNERRAFYAYRLLREAVPEATISLGADGMQMIVIARPKVHEKIKNLIDQLIKQENGPNSPTLAAYTLESTTATSALSVLRQVVPEATFTTGTDPQQLIAWARPLEHEKIKNVIAELGKKGPADQAAVFVTYPLKWITSTVATRTLQQAVPGAQVSTGADSHQIIVWARPADQEAVKTTLSQIDTEGPPDSVATSAVYRLEGMSETDVYYAMSALRQACPSATFTTTRDPTVIIAWARPEDHKRIASLVEEFLKEPPAELAPTMEIYTLQKGDSQSAIRILTPIVPAAKLSTGSEVNQLVAWATKADHEKIKAAVDRMAEQASPETAPRMEVYTLRATTALSALQVLQRAVPLANLNVGADPYQVIAWATPTQHEMIRAAVEKLAQSESADTAPKLVIYPLPESTNVYSAMQFLRQTVPQAQFGYGADPRQLVVWARPAEHDKIKQVLDEIAAKSTAPVTKVYRLNYADPSAALTALRTLVPTATIALDTVNRSLVASAMPDDHKKIDATIQEMDRKDIAQAAEPRIYQLINADPYNVMSVLRGLFRTQGDVQLSVDENSDSLVAVASPAKHEEIQRLVDQVEQAAKAMSGVEVQIYPLKNIDSYSAQQVVNNMLATTGSRAQVTVDRLNNQMVAIALPEEQQTIQQALEHLRTEERQLEIFQLDFVDLDTAETAIRTLFADEGYSTTPSIDTDPVTMQLFVRATRAQLDETRRLLIKMGETGMAAPSTAAGGNLRVIPMDGDIGALVEEIRRVWPELRSNELRTVTPGTTAPLSPSSTAPAKPAATSASPTTTANPAPVTAPAAPASPTTAPVTPTAAPAQPAPASETKPGTAIQLPHRAIPIPSHSIPLRLSPGRSEGSRATDRAARGAIDGSSPRRASGGAGSADGGSSNTAARSRIATGSEGSSSKGAPSAAPSGRGMKGAPGVLMPSYGATISKSLNRQASSLLSGGSTSRGSSASGAAGTKTPAAGSVSSSSRGGSPNGSASRGSGSGGAGSSSSGRTRSASGSAPVKIKSRSSRGPRGSEGATGHEGIPGPDPRERGAVTYAALQIPPEAVPAQEKVPENSDPVAPAQQKPSTAPVSPPASQGSEPAEPAAQPGQEGTLGAPVTIMMGEGSLTIASEDKEALDELESLLRTIAQRSAVGGRDFSIFPIKNTSASQVAATLLQMFNNPARMGAAGNRGGSNRSNRFGRSQSGRAVQPVVIVPDDRLNTILVQGSRSDRTQIESLIKVLDTAQVPASLEAQKPKFIPIENTDAMRVQQVIMQVFRTQFYSGSRTYGAGVSPQVAVDQETNTLIVTAPAPLIDDITQLAKDLDQAALDDPSRRMKIIPLQNSNAEKMRAALNNILRSGYGSYRGGSSYRGGGGGSNYHSGGSPSGSTNRGPSSSYPRSR